MMRLPDNSEMPDFVMQQSVVELLYEQEGDSPPSRQVFALENRGDVFLAAGDQPRGRRGILSRDGKRICSIRQLEGPVGLWLIEK